MTVQNNAAHGSPPLLRVFVLDGDQPERAYEFRQPFKIGRSPECAVCVPNKFLSRSHVEVVFENSEWTVRDLNSSNGMFLGDARVAKYTVTGTPTKLRLGLGGPFVSVHMDVPPSAQLSTHPAVPPTPSVQSYVQHYFGQKEEGAPIGQHTMFVRAAFSEVQKRQRNNWLVLLGALAVVVVLVSGYAAYQHREVGKQRALAESVFYSVKALDVDIANFQRVAIETNSDSWSSQLRGYQERRRKLELRYAQFAAAVGGRDKKLTEQQQLTMRIARIFGECELAMPSTFQAEIEKYIQKWKSTGRLARAVAAANEKGYTRTIAKELLAVGLPPQFFYLALQESDFDPYISGPETHMGIAKGMWQFIPETAIKYGMKVGPLVALRRPDPSDDRHHWDIETKAAAQYMRDLYASDAQASGLLVMACYNWGEDRVLPLVRSLPANPEERNFWKIQEKYGRKLPAETYDYVLSIVSAAIIGENPRLFGFDFDNPLGHLESH